MALTPSRSQEAVVSSTGARAASVSVVTPRRSPFCTARRRLRIASGFFAAIDAACAERPTAASRLSTRARTSFSSIIGRMTVRPEKIIR